jgi:hypothetical protein
MCRVRLTSHLKTSSWICQVLHNSTDRVRTHDTRAIAFTRIAALAAEVCTLQQEQSASACS